MINIWDLNRNQEINDPTLPKYISQFLAFKQDLKVLEVKCK